MAKYYGTLRGKAETQATRTGSSASGIKATVQSYEGSLSVYMRDNRRDENDTIVEVCYATDESTSSPNNVGFYGTFSELVALLEGRE